MCRVLRAVLPDRYGICRGYVTSITGEVAGDDIIVFERASFPSLRLQQRDDFSRKEYVPIEAVYAYLETKYTLNTYGTDGQSLTKAATQVAAVKTLLSGRATRDVGQYDPYVAVEAFDVHAATHFPSIRNPPFAGILAGAMRVRNGEPRTTDPQVIGQALAESMVKFDPASDVLILGPNFVVLPIILSSDASIPSVGTTFFMKGKTRYKAHDVSGLAFGIGLASSMAALDWIRLGRLPWHAIIGNGLGLK